MRVIVADDDPFSRRVFVDVLAKWGYDVVAATEGPEAAAIIERQTEPVIASRTSRLPRLDGLDICRKIMARSGGVPVFVFLMGGQARRDEVLKGADTLADDFLIKPCDPMEFRIRNKLAKRFLEQQNANREQGTRDPLTGVWTRDSIVDLLGQELDRAKRQHLPVSVFCFSVDKLRQVSDAQGSNAAERVLTEVAKMAAGELRAYDAIGRGDGADFVVILPNCESSVAEKHAAKFGADVAAKEFEVAQFPVTVTISAGVTGTDIIRLNETDALLLSSRSALERARTSGGNCVELARITDLANA
jgi:diguanylate cyclase (GGDEF)-like protein